jgi:CelD/BcsL family acetyltransferase involved in cellulose biosynthesis
MLRVIEERYPLSAAFRQDWARLYADCQQASVFLDLAWLEAGLRYCAGADNVPRAFRFVGPMGPTLGMALLQEAPVKVGLGQVRSLRTIDYNTQRTLPILARGMEDSAASILALWRELGDHYDVFDFFKLDAMGDALDELAARLEHEGVAVHLTRFNEQPRLVLPDDVDELLRLRNRVSRKKLRWGRNRLEEQLGPLTLTRLRAPEDFGERGLDALCDVVFDLHQRSWQGKDMSLDQRHQRQAYYRAAMDGFVASGRFDAALLEAGGQCLAYDLNLVDRGAVYMLIGGYDPAWRRYSPGSLLFSRWAQDSIARGDRVLEFGGDYVDYKAHWATETTSSYHLRVLGRTLRGRLKSALGRP